MKIPKGRPARFVRPGLLDPPPLRPFRPPCSDQAGLVYGVATEDMDALTFGSPRLVRHLMASTQTANTTEFDLPKILEVGRTGPSYATDLGFRV